MACAMRSEVSNSPLLFAPAHVTRHAGKFKTLSHKSWRVPAGEPVAQFLGCNDPADIAAYDWDRARCVYVYGLFVQLRPTVLRGPSAKQQTHSFLTYLC